MTNSRITDPEILELRYPVVLEQFSIRKGSGGSGDHCGGDGVVRRVRFLEPMSACILANRRCIAPFGMNGGAPGAVGRNWAERNDGSSETLSSRARIELEAGEVFVIETPGGGGWGAPAKLDAEGEV